MDPAGVLQNRLADQRPADGFPVSREGELVGIGVVAVGWAIVLIGVVVVAVEWDSGKSIAVVVVVKWLVERAAKY